MGKVGARVEVAPLIDAEQFLLKAADFLRWMKKVAPDVQEQYELRLARAAALKKKAEAAGQYAKPAGGVVDGRESATSLLWRKISEKNEVCKLFPEFVKVASLTLVGTSVRNERDFSAKSLVEDDRRASLGPAHLDACLRIFISTSLFPDLSSFPTYDAIISEFGAGDIDRRSMNATMADKPPQEEEIEEDDDEA